MFYPLRYDKPWEGSKNRRGKRDGLGFLILSLYNFDRGR